MKRRLTKLALFLVFGAVVNLAVAWVIAWRTGPILLYAGHTVEIEPSSVASLWKHHTRAGWPELPGSSTLQKVYGRSELIIHAPRPDPSADWTSMSVTRYEVGLPMRSVASISISWSVAGNTGTEIKDGWKMGAPFPIVPYMPHWPGFAVNTVFYAPILWLLFVLIKARRKIRRSGVSASSEAKTCTD